MGFKKTLCSILAAAALSLPCTKSDAAEKINLGMRSKPASAQYKGSSIVYNENGGIRSTKPPIDISDKVKRFFLQSEEEKAKKSKEYSVGMAWRWADRNYQGFITEMSDKDRRFWLSLGSYFSEKYFVSEDKVSAGDITHFILKDPILERIERRNIFLDSQFNYTVYRYTMNPNWKRPFQMEIEMRVGAGMGLRIDADERRYISAAGTEEQSSIKSPIPELSLDARFIMSAGPVIKIGFVQARYIFEVDHRGQIGHVLGLGIRL